jgi:uncharacterized membrane protein (DUF2068 family)
MERPPGTKPDRSWHKIDWELVACGFRGHELVGTDAAELRPGDSSLVRDGGGARWHRCLRCDAWVALPLPEAPARRHPPDQTEIEVPLRGKALRDKVVLRIIAVDRVFHFLILGLLGIAVLAVAANEGSLRREFYRVVTDLEGAAGGAVQYSQRGGFVGELNKLFALRSGTLHTVGIVLIAYALLEGVEAIGLWLAKRWAEYLTFIATTILLVPEVYEIAHKATALKIVGLIINIVIVVYLLYAKRLFGLRGGGAADARERAADMGWDAIERATPAVAGAAAERPAPSPAP